MTVLEIIGYFVFGVYLVGLTFITIFCLMQFHLLLKYKLRNVREIIKPEGEDYLPKVTIQLPIFNEQYVVERLIDNICKLDYPKEKLQIHILDDSTDETVQITAKKVEEYKKLGFDIEQITRVDRVGYKAGALKAAMPFCDSEFVAIFDADFLPEPDFLKKTMPFFKDNNIGVVQTRWGHINQNYSLLTELQAFQLNVHFTVEQKGRYKGNYLLQFNGTAGVWRAKCIEEAGGWEADTLTEDLDLSYRAQLKGWEIIFLEDVLAPAELPAEMHGLKSQQFRWMKGGAETAKKILPTIWKSNLSLMEKFHASSHLLSSSVFLFIFIIGVFSVPLIYFIGEINFNMDILAFFMISLLSIGVIYFVANVQTAWKGDSLAKKIVKFIFLFPVFLSLSMGLSLHNSIAVLQGYRGKKSAFIRTPKFNIVSLQDKFNKEKYRKTRISFATIMEGVLSIYFLLAVIGAIYTGNTELIIYHFALSIGFGTIFYYSIRHLQNS